jgi:flagellar hook-associated protein FlgK
MNSANNTVDTSQLLTNNQSLANSPAAALAGSLTVTVNGVAQTFNYTTAAGGNSDTIDDFVTNFNAAHMGVTASFDAASQRIVFARDEQNESLVLRGTQQNNPETPTFQIADSNFVAATPATSLIGAIGAGGINNIQQNATNAFGGSDNGAANAMISMFQLQVGIPNVETTSPTAITAAMVGTNVTIALPAGVNNIQVGQVLTLDAQPNGVAPQENVTVSAISMNPVTGIESVTFVPANVHAANYTVASAPVQTLQQFFGGLTTQVGLDTQTAITGTTTQTNLTQNINNVRQSIAGINIDEETQNLVKYQNAYQAAAKTIATLNSLLGTIINGLGVGQ